MVSQCFTKALDVGLEPVEESVKCVVLQTSKMCLSANQMQAVGPSTQCTICNCLVREQEELHMLSGS
eukprot:4595950-Ditylum_brightwellii.AAC.1